MERVILCMYYCHVHDVHNIILGQGQIFMKIPGDNSWTVVGDDLTPLCNFCIVV